MAVSTPSSIANNEPQGASVGRGRGNGRRGRGQSSAGGGQTESTDEVQIEARTMRGQGRSQARARGRGGQTRGGRRPSGDCNPVLEPITSSVNNADAPQSPAPAETSVDKQLEQRIEELQRLSLIELPIIFTNIFRRCSGGRAGSKVASRDSGCHCI